MINIITLFELSDSGFMNFKFPSLIITKFINKCLREYIISCFEINCKCSEAD